ncbi:MAG TPA: hypothetical protein VKB84_15275 [Candidatus Binataceae bacterium]|nr:hypothetical protein [Candidatus Binataceae bacterium]
MQRSEHFASPGVVYRTTCENPGCGHTFDLRITAKEAGLLAGTMACPRCRRHGGMLKRMGRLDDRLFVAKLVYKMIGVGASSSSDDGDLLSDIR